MTVPCLFSVVDGWWCLPSGLMWEVACSPSTSPPLHTTTAPVIISECHSSRRTQPRVRGTWTNSTLPTTTWTPRRSNISPSEPSLVSPSCQASLAALQVPSQSIWLANWLGPVRTVAVQLRKNLQSPHRQVRTKKSDWQECLEEI